MDPASEEFFPKQLDRTPYGACYGLVAVMLVVTGLGIVFLWNAGGTLKRAARTLPWNRPHAEELVPDGATNLVDEIEQKLQGNVPKVTQPPLNVQDIQNQVTNNLEDAAKDAVKQEVQNQLQQGAQGLQQLQP